ncbi:glycosyltransferase family protein [Anaerocolumna xylanovorans]|uniref:Spore protein YkvP/CgeB glycosyl transferase-like domain-containing protein n=1 Tax=Anaerocolumna xylanovorans DSM 12503 TaxID=1121345 RepID=A0A1M7Y814_9FIRM|nr:glycosyltransferase [Anaerocolumna xylanovorans]SHO48759.1 protein of unknown function [Anaerocolumna xylanovorans DSM 12503]
MRAVICKVGQRMETAVAEELRREALEVGEFARILKDKDYDVEYIQALSDYIKEYGADMVWSMEYIPVISRACLVEKVPYVAWIIGESWNTLYSSTIQNPWNFVFVAEGHIAERFWKKNPGHIFYLPPGAKADVLSEVPGTVGLCNWNMEYPVYYMKEDCSEYMKGYVRGLIEAQQRVYGYHFLPNLITKKRKTELGKILLEPMRGKDYYQKNLQVRIDDFLCDTITRNEREEAVQIMKDMEIFHEGDGLCTVNVNVASRKCRTGIPYDMLRVMGAGGFVITNYQDKIASSFVIGEEIVVYEDMKELQDKIEYYLEHEEERKQIAIRGRRRVKEDFSLQQRVGDVFYAVTEGLRR